MIDLVLLNVLMDHRQVNEKCVAVLINEDGETVHDGLVDVKRLGGFGSLLHEVQKRINYEREVLNS